MRYRPEHKAEIHQQIVKDASRRVRPKGMTGVAVSAVMRDAGLTHGGFTSISGARTICSCNPFATASRAKVLENVRDFPLRSLGS